MMADDAKGGPPRSAGQPEEMAIPPSDALIDGLKALSPPHSVLANRLRDVKRFKPDITARTGRLPRTCVAAFEGLWHT
jgi:hypothetical protein